MRRVFCGFLFAMFLSSAAQAAEVAPVHALAMHGAPKYAADFQHLDYVNPDAPKGGEIRLAGYGAFDSLHPYILKGQAAPGLSLIYQTLMTNTDDEAFSEYGLIAATVEMPEDRSWVAFNLRPEARWHDGKPVTADDVVWTFNALMKDGHPTYRAYYAHVKEAVAENPQRVKFIFDMTGNRELPLIVGQLPVLPRHYWQDKDFSATTLTPPLGSGPYKVASVDAGRRIVYERVKDWWAKDLPIMRGQYNFDRVSYDVFLDENVMRQALFSNAYDFRQENIAKAWNAEYDKKPVQAGFIKKEEISHSQPTGMQAFALNTRRPVFADARVRQALNYAFDFEWSNKQFAFGGYKRTASYFSNSELASSGLPQGRELEILNEFRGQIPTEVFDKEYKNPATDGSGRGIRDNLAVAKKLLEQAGWTLGPDKILQKDGKKFQFEILLNTPSFERWAAPFIANLKKLGIDASLRTVDTAQYQNRMDGFDFDMIVSTFAQSLSPGNEQAEFWGSKSADVKGSRNVIGIKDPVIDELIKRIIIAKDREELIATTRALDRVLLWNHFVIPQWHINYHRIAYWDKFARPAKTAPYALGVLENWWEDAAKAAALKSRTSVEQR
jgi:microcin C transport system substrate-binding protein